MMQSKDITVFQLKAARAGLDLSVSELHRKTGISRATINRIEKQTPNLPPSCNITTVFHLRKFFEANGIIFDNPNKISFDIDSSIPDIF